MRKVGSLALVVALSTGPVAADCVGDLEGAWERRPAVTGGTFEPVEEFRIDSRTGILQDCTRDVDFDARLIRDGAALTFLYRARSQELRRVRPGVYVSAPERRLQDGQTWEFRYRVVALN